MKGQTERVQTQRNCPMQQIHCLSGLNAKFTLQWPVTTLVIYRDACHELSARSQPGEFFQFQGGIKGENTYTKTISKVDVAGNLGRGGEDRLLGGHAQPNQALNFTPRGNVESDAFAGKQFQHRRMIIGFDRKIHLCSRKGGFKPAGIFAQALAVQNQKGCFFAWQAG